MSYSPYEPQLQILLPASLHDWLPKGHLDYFTSDTIDALNLNTFHARHEGGSAQPIDFPSMIVRVLSITPKTHLQPAQCAFVRPVNCPIALDQLEIAAKNASSCTLSDSGWFKSDRLLGKVLLGRQKSNIGRRESGLH